MNESRELKNAEQLEELLLLTEEIQEELEQKDQLIVELKTQLSESLTLNEKLNKENRAGNIQALKNDLKLADRALRSEKEKLRSANVMIGECQDKIRCLTQQRDYARTHQKIVEIPSRYSMKNVKPVTGQPIRMKKRNPKHKKSDLQDSIKQKR